MRKLFIVKICTILVAGLVLAGCEGKEGPQGPAGAQGAKGDPGINGTNGAKGDTGAKGDKGDTGTANVIYSDWLAIPATPNFKGSNYKEYAIAAPKITQEVFNSGLVYAYARSGGSASIYPLSYTFTNSYSCRIRIQQSWVIYGEDWVSGTVNSTWINSDKTDYFSHIRYVIIPGGIKARVAGLDYSDYEAVKAYYGLED